VQERDGIGRRLVVPVGCTAACHGTGNHPVLADQGQLCQWDAVLGSDYFQWPGKILQ